MKEEERREAGERVKKKERENIFFNGRGERNSIK